MKVVKRIAIVLVSLVVIVLLATVVMYYLTRQRMEAAFDVQPATLDIPSDSASLALGKHWVDIYCTNCHGVTLEGKRMFEDPSIGFIEAPNLTSGKGGIALSYKDADWVRKWLLARLEAQKDFDNSRAQRSACFPPQRQQARDIH